MSTPEPTDAEIQATIDAFWENVKDSALSTLIVTLDYGRDEGGWYYDALLGNGAAFRKYNDIDALNVIASHKDQFRV